MEEEHVLTAVGPILSETHPWLRKCQELNLWCLQSPSGVKFRALPSGLCHQGDPQRRDNAEPRSSAEPVRDGIPAGHANCQAHSFQTSGGCRTCMDRSCCWLALFMVASYSLVDSFTSFSDCPGTHLGIKSHLCMPVAQTLQSLYIRQPTGPRDPQGTRKRLSTGPLRDREELSNRTGKAAFCTGWL